ncbi:sensor histidine kinase [Micromonospora sp. NBC_00898]|uniref:sensor histidine kinase n=1 Tax=Micromonospora sp. NBC_00898 TaxID=2975981 RepID=UPI00386A8277|nr:sensor histidine kinase [Micromonospora sp. NBC_00898]
MSGLLEGRGTRGRNWFDGVLAAAMAVGVVLGVIVGAGATSATEPSTHALDAAGCLLLIVAASALAARRASPVPATVVATAAFLVYYGRDYPVPVLAALPATITIYTLASLSYRWPAVAATAALSVGKLVAGWVRSGDPLHSVPEMLWVSGWLVAILIWGEVTRHRRAYLHEVHQRAIDAERTREEAAQRRADEERLRIAQELHDTLTHAISVVNVQSSVALHLLHRKPELIEPALLAISEASLEAMRELRATLGVLRVADTAEPPSLAQLPLLAARFERSGLRVRLHVRGETRPVPPNTERAVYRMVQEALTNTARHAAPATVDVELTYQPARLDLRVDDDGPGAAAPVTEGYGLRGMRERAAALGGTVATASRPGGGFQVHASLPLEHPAPAEDATGHAA